MNKFIILALTGNPHSPISLPFQVEKTDQYPNNRKDERIGRNWRIGNAACGLRLEQEDPGSQILIFL